MCQLEGCITGLAISYTFVGGRVAGNTPVFGQMVPMQQVEDAVSGKGMVNATFAALPVAASRSLQYRLHFRTRARSIQGGRSPVFFPQVCDSKPRESGINILKR